MDIHFFPPASLTGRRKKIVNYVDACTTAFVSGGCTAGYEGELFILL